MAFLSGLATNAALWVFAPSVSWLWWNVSGCVVTLGVAGLALWLRKHAFNGDTAAIITPPLWMRVSLPATFAGILLLLALMQWYL